ncbi:MAG: chemotaxis protein CheR [Treponema sp.]|jgi:chemotaxis protein methyltransferase CheR|nr:chemotaxis protein CheR [Treponema sp.]
MLENTTASVITSDIPDSVPKDVLSSPALLFLYYRIEQILGIKAGSEALKNLNEYIEKTCGSTFIENPAAYEQLLTSREQIYDISKFLTVNETYFFREGVHFEILTSLLPEFAKLNRPIQICSAAVSIGCEAYSIAMMLDYYNKNGLNLDFSVDAFDVNIESIETAKNARYTANAFRSDGTAWKNILDSYLIPDNGEYIISQDIRSKVRFFPHNIMRGIEKQYDVIFFRNALIYFSTKNRLSVFNNIAESLYNNGFLFLGISETSSVNHPLLLNRYSPDAFYFQKTGVSGLLEQLDIKQIDIHRAKNKHIKDAEKITRSKKHDIPQAARQAKLTVNCKEISDILKDGDGKSNAEHVLYALKSGNSTSLSGSCLAAAVVYYLNAQNFDLADKILLYLEEHASCSSTKFLRGEYHFLRGNSEEAEKYFQEAAVKDKFFWPAFYRIAILASEGNRIRYEYKIKKAIECIELSQSLQPKEKQDYECFMGGFSSDYFSRILEKKLT